MPAKSALDQIRAALERGKALLAADMSSTRSLSALIREVRGWDALNKEVLHSIDQSFTAEYQQTLKPLLTLRGEIIADSLEVQAALKDRIDFLASINERLKLRSSRSGENNGSNTFPRIFIVHGHDDMLLLQVKDFLQNALNLPEPIVLFQQPNVGRTIIEKFEECADRADAALVLLTPDDFGGKQQETGGHFRARQNVIFELGFFVGRFGRKSGRTIVLYKGNLEIPSDFSGVAYIDVSNGIEAASEKIRKELRAMQEH